MAANATRYRAQAADVRASVDLTGAPDELVAQLGPVRAHAERHVATVEGRDSGRTYTAPTPVHRTEAGHVPVQRTMGRHTEADEYELLEGAPVGMPEGLRSYIRERMAQASDAHWAARNARADAGQAMSRAAYRNAKRKATRAQR